MRSLLDLEMKEKNTTFTRKILLLVTSLILVTTSHVNGFSTANKINTLHTFGICHAQLDGKVFPISNRSDEYIYCISQEDIRLNCPMGKVFNTAAGGCVSKNFEQQTNCDLYTNGVYQCPYDCHTFIICSEGTMEVGNCPGDTIFNPTLKLCDTADDVVCQSPLPSESPSTTTESTVNICTNQPNNALLPYASNCAMFIRCLNGDPQIVECPNGSLFDPYLLICCNANNVICSSTTAESIIDTTTTTPIAYENQCFDQSSGKTFPYFEDCQKYYYCWGDNTSSVLPCPANNWYNPITGRCGPNVSPNACQISKSTTIATITTTQRTTLSPEELCMNADMGITYPISSDCQQYIICTGNGDSMILRCPNKNWFNPENGKCGPNVSPTACQEIGNTETTTTVLTPPNDIGICYNKDYGEIVSYPNDCQKYVVCATPVPVAFYCQNGYYFNSARQECVLLAESDCKTAITSTTTTTTTMPPLTIETPTICTNSERTNFPYVENCQWYYHCINDYVYMMTVCNTNEYFDPLTGECSNEVAANACKEDYQESNQKTGNILVSIVSGPCANKPVGFKVPYPHDCTKFIQCNTLLPAILDCREGLEFSMEQQRCMSPNLANCSQPNLITALTSSTDVPPTTTYDQDIPSTKRHKITTCDHLPDYSTLPDAKNCSRYIICLKGKGSIANCTSNSYYNIAEGSCNEYTSPNACYENSDSSQSSTTTTTTIIPPTNSNICCGHSMGLHVPYPNDYTKYIVCAYPIPYIVACVNGTFYDKNALECMGSRDNDGDGNGQNLGSIVSIIDTGNSCSNVLYGTAIQYKGDCSLYVLCFGDKGALLQCNNNWYFNPKMRQCVPPSMYQCPW